MEKAGRRSAVGFLGLALATLLLRNQLGEALVVRGDELLVRNDYGGARMHYERALFFDPDSEGAVDRLAFVASRRRSRAALTEGISVTSRYLQYHSKSPTVLFDRGLCFLLLRDYSRALPDFRSVALLTREPQKYVFAGWAAKRSGSVREAVTFWEDGIVAAAWLPAGRVGLARVAEVIAAVFTAASFNVLYLLAAEAALAKAGCKKHLRGSAALAGICVLTGLECFSSRALPLSLAIPAFLITGCVGACVVTDIISGLILDAITLPTLSAILILSAMCSRFAACAEGTLCCSLLFLILYIASSGRGIGLGDAKLGACIGAFFGPLYGAEAIGLAFTIGGAIAAAVLLLCRVARNTPVPFAPFLAAGTLGVVMFNRS